MAAWTWYGPVCLLVTVVSVTRCQFQVPDAEESALLDGEERRVILGPGRWKIRALGDRPVYHAYSFLLGRNWTAPHDIGYPECSRVACGGLPRSQLGCEHICNSGTWLDANKAVTTAALDQTRAARELDAAFNDLVALVDTHVGSDLKGDAQTSELRGYNPDIDSTDVMSYHRSLIDDAVAAALMTVCGVKTRDGMDIDETSPRANTSAFVERMNVWKSGALLLSVQLNSITFALIGARERLLACTQGVIRSDMTGCAPGLPSEFYTDVPAVGRPMSSSRGLVLEVRRNRWNPVLLSRWYMAFLDSSRGNRTCWLDRGMLNDSRSNYREPNCDGRGLCEPPQLDDDTLSVCEVKADGEVSPECPIVCGSQCFGPLCYERQSNAYALRTAIGAEHGSLGSLDILVASRPRMLSKAHSVSEDDVRGSLVEMRNRANRALELLNRGVSVVHAVDEVDTKLRRYMARLEASEVECSRGAAECEGVMVRVGAAASASLLFSVVTCPMLIVFIVKMRC